MKKILIFIILVIIIVISIFTFKHFQENNTNSTEISENKNNVISSDYDERYFLLYIDEVLTNNGNIIVKGSVLKGSVEVNDEISIVGLGKKEVNAIVTKIENENKGTNSVNEGDTISLTLDCDIEEDYISQGQAVIISGTTKPIYNITAKLTSITTNSINEIKDKANIFNINSDIECSVEVISEETNEIKIKLDIPIVVANEIEFVLKSDNEIIANGICIDN